MDGSQLCKSQFQLLFLICAALAASTDTRAAGTTCHLSNSAASRAPDITVSVKQPARQIRTGEPITIAWKVAPTINFGCRTPLYLVFTTPMRTRFEGDKFLAFPPQAEAPYGIRYGREHTRVFVPLHLGRSQLEGQLILKSYDAGPLLLDWALVEVPKLADRPQTRADLALGRERTTSPASLGTQISIAAGNPTIVVRDRFTTEIPKQTIRSNSGEFELQVFPDFYRVLDAKSGELLQERSGRHPNFSPTSRFIGAFAGGPGLEIVDLFAGQVVTSNDALQRDRGIDGTVHIAAWSPGDAILALSVNTWGNFEVQQALVDGSQRSFKGTCSRACTGIQVPLRVDIEAGIVAYDYDSQKGWRSLLDRSFGKENVSDEALAKTPSRSDGSKSPELLLQRARQIAVQSLAPLGEAGFFKPDAFFSAHQSEAARGPWLLSGAARLSHDIDYDPDEEANCKPPSCHRDREYSEFRRRLNQALVFHDSKAAPLSLAASIPHDAEARMIDIRTRERVSEKSEANGKGERDRKHTLWKRLGQFGLVFDRETVIRPAILKQPEHNDNAPDGLKPAIAAMIRSLPRARTHLRVADDQQQYTQMVSDAYWGAKGEARILDTSTIETLASWKVKDRHYFLLHTYYGHGVSSRNWLFLLHGTPKGASKLIDFTHRLRYRVGRRPSGLDDKGKLDISDYGTHLGFGGWPRTFDAVSIEHGRYLIATGTWTSEERRWLLLVDLSTDRILLFNREIPDASSALEFALTRDGRTLVQSGTNGQLVFYDVAKSGIALRGFDIDDELVAYNRHGYYDASPEGAHFIFLKFPGLSGYNSFHQFAKTLNRPDLVRAALNGKADGVDPRLSPPPTVSITADVDGAGPDRRALLRLSGTSALGLEKIRIFIDGRLSREAQVSGSSATTEAAVPLLPESRWVTAVAVDKAGYESVPQGRLLPGKAEPPTGRLFGIAVGTDIYEDATIDQLNVAKFDADSFSKEVTALKGTRYSDVTFDSYLDATGLRDSLPGKIREVVAKAGERDTIMLFAAGHGFRDSASGQFFLATRETVKSNLAETSIGWNEIAAAFGGAKARVIVFLDACRSGATGDSGTNDDAVSTLINAGTSLTVIAAAKGRQDSLEFGSGGAFTRALIDAISSEQSETDTNRNGVIELAELYSVVKRNVVARTQGAQTPWIARNLMVGEIPLF